MLFTGGASVHLQMLNKQSRSYFQRAFPMSGTAFHSYVITKANHVQSIRECSNIFEMDKLIEYLKTEKSTALLDCPHLEFPDDFELIWAPVIESEDTEGAFLIKTPHEIYCDPNEDAPIMDTMFSFTAQVLHARTCTPDTAFYNHFIAFSVVGNVVGNVKLKFS